MYGREKENRENVEREMEREIRKIYEEKGVDGLVGALKYSSKEYRQATAKMIGNIIGEEAVELLIEALKDGDVDVQYSAANSLGRLGDSRAVKPVIELLQKGEKRAREGAAHAIALLKDKKALDVMVVALEDESCWVRSDAISYLGEIGWERATERFIELLTDESYGSRVSLAEGLSKIGDAIAIEPILEILDEEEGIEREKISKSLIKLIKSNIENSHNLILEHIEVGEIGKANTIIEIIMNQIRVLKKKLDYKEIIVLPYGIIEKYNSLENKRKLTKDRIKLIETTLESLNEYYYYIFKKKQEIPLQNKESFEMFFSEVVKTNWKKILEIGMWELMVQTVLFYLSAGSKGKIPVLTSPKWIGKGLTSELLPMYIEQTKKGIIEFAEKTNHHYLNRYITNFEEQIRELF